MSFKYAIRDRTAYGVRRDESSSSSGGKRILTRRQDRDQAVTELKEHHQKILDYCHRHEELKDHRCFCAYHPDDANCHCFTHFLDDPKCHHASVDCSADTSNPNCMNMAVAVDTSSSSPDAAAASATQTTAPSITTTLEPPFATSSSGMNATDMSSTAASPGPVASVTSSKGVNIPVIVGAAVGGVVFLALLYLAIMLCLRRRRKRAERAPSAEFLDNSNSLLRRMHTAGSLPIQSPPTSVYGGVTVTADGLGDMPPAFSPGSFSDPVVEKVIGSVQEREAWHHRNARQGSRDIRSSAGTPVA